MGFRELAKEHPYLNEADWVEPMDLLGMWFKSRTNIDLEWFLEKRKQFLEALEPNLEIIGGMLL